MLTPARRPLLWLLTSAQFLVLMPLSGVAHAQRGDHRHGWDHRDRYEHRRDWQRERERRDRRDRRENRQAAGVVAGVVGTALLLGAISAANNRAQSPQHARANYCLNRYGNYDAATDTYRAADGYAYRCR